MRAALKWVKAIALHEKTHADLKPQREAEGRARVEYNTQMQMLMPVFASFPKYSAACQTFL
jgi:hypothetical protein